MSRAVAVVNRSRDIGAPSRSSVSRSRPLVRTSRGIWATWRTDPAAATTSFPSVMTVPDGEQGRSWPRNDLCGECGHWHDHTGRQLLAMRDWQGERYAIPKGHMPRNNADDAGGREYGDCPGEHPTDGEETSSGTSDLPANTEGRAVEGGASPSGPSLAEQLRQESLRADAFFRGREDAQARAEREKARADRAEAELARARSDVDAELRRDLETVLPRVGWFGLSIEQREALDRIRERLQDTGA
jgi:hypothetical protein